MTYGGVAYYSLPEQGEIWAFDVTTFQPTVVMAGLTMPEHLAIDATHVYFTGKPAAEPPTASIASRTVVGKVARVTPITSGQTTGIVLRDGFLYWAAGGAFFRTSK